MRQSVPAAALLTALLSAAPGAIARAQPAPGPVPPPAAGPAGDTFRIVESVPEATLYGEPGVPRTQQVWLEMIRGATRSIDIAAFYVTDSPSLPSGRGLAPVLDAVIARARAGVPVRLLVEQSFMKETGPSIQRLRGVPNLAIAVLPTAGLTGGVLHAKYMIVDSRTVFVGSQNWDWRALDEIHEIGAEITSPRFAASFEADFAELWGLAAHPDLPAARKQAVMPPDFAPATRSDPVVLQGAGEQLVAYPAFSPPQMMPAWLTPEEPALIGMIEAARRIVRIQVMTLSAIHSYGPKGFWPGLDTALRDAAARGVQVEIIVADWALHEPMQAYLKSLAVFPGITVKFSVVPPSPSGFIPFARVEHCKYAVADDDAAFIGTGNWEWSYFADTVDASVFVHGRGPAATLGRIFERDWSGPYVTTLSPSVSYQAPRTR